MAESRFVFEARTIQRMELLVLSTLKWRMQAVTPFSFIDYFIRKINKDEFPSRTSIMRSIQLILSIVKGCLMVSSYMDCNLSVVAIMKKEKCERSDVSWLGELIAGIDFLEYRPSEIAAAVAISIAGETQTVDIEKAISVLIEPVEKVKLGGPGPKNHHPQDKKKRNK